MFTTTLADGFAGPGTSISFDARSSNFLANYAAADQQDQFDFRCFGDIENEAEEEDANEETFCDGSPHAW